MAQVHSHAVNAIIVGVQRAVPDARVFKRVVGAFRAIESPERIVAVGDKGQADLWGFVRGRPRAVPFEIEVKVGKDRLRAEQEAWAALCSHMGVPYLMVRASGKDDIPQAVRAAADFVRGLLQ